ncbi:Hypothetical predicted protein [Pelobates cultripes]|uniref:Uncharacterized protein n=1 Tax=Pelobates cultripes TaxID=61616 RepID=A0AAD1T2V0_PELCU|nr:Hypothetical predicted protein [Pelobates cultripes]
MTSLAGLSHVLLILVLCQGSAAESDPFHYDCKDEIGDSVQIKKLDQYWAADSRETSSLESQGTVVGAGGTGSSTVSVTCSVVRFPVFPLSLPSGTGQEAEAWKLRPPTALLFKGLGFWRKDLGGGSTLGHCLVYLQEVPGLTALQPLRAPTLTERPWPLLSLPTGSASPDCITASAGAHSHRAPLATA